MTKHVAHPHTAKHEDETHARSEEKTPRPEVVRHVPRKVEEPECTPAESLWKSENPKATEQYCDLAPGYRAELERRAAVKG